MPYGHYEGPYNTPQADPDPAKTLHPTALTAAPKTSNVGALIIRIGFWADCGQKSEASAAKDILCITQTSKKSSSFRAFKPEIIKALIGPVVTLRAADLDNKPYGH